MLRPLAFTQSPKPSTRRRVVALAAVGVIEIGLVAALLSGLAARAVQELPHVLNVVDVMTPPTPLEKTVQPVKPVLVQPQMPSVPIPEIRIQQPKPAHAITAVATPVPVVTAPSVMYGPVAAPAPAAPAPVAAVAAPTALQAIARTHTSPPYPEMARRLGQQGQVRVHIKVGANGQVTDVAVVKSSGSDILDDAAKSWVLSNWRYRPATTDGASVAAETDAIVMFDLKTSH